MEHRGGLGRRLVRGLAVEPVVEDRAHRAVGQRADLDRPRGGGFEAIGAERYLRIAAEPKAHIFFTGHVGNFELIPIAAETFGLKVTAMFRPPNNPFIADYILSTRKSAMGGLIASRRGAAIALARILEDGGNVGMLVDQKFSEGIRTTFFGRACESSPLLPKLARQFECDVYPVRSMRLPARRKLPSETAACSLKNIWRVHGILKSRFWRINEATL